jgi:hypothetical protein
MVWRRLPALLVAASPAKRSEPSSDCVSTCRGSAKANEQRAECHEKKDDGGDGGTAEEGSLIDDQVAAKYQLERILRDPSSAKYDAVRGYRYRTSDNKQGYNFCGTVNAKNGFGGYNGPQRFSANAAIAMIDDGSDGFQKIWDKYCTDAEGGQEIWF